MKILLACDRQKSMTASHAVNKFTLTGILFFIEVYLMAILIDFAGVNSLLRGFKENCCCYSTVNIIIDPIQRMHVWSNIACE